jgi:predicted DNA-binding transcriptional regulator AlpA
MKHVLLTVSQAAQVKGVSTKAIYAAIARKRLPRRYSKGNLVVREYDLLAWEQSKSPGGRPKGRTMSLESKLRLSQSQKRRWQRQKEAPAA